MNLSATAEYNGPNIESDYWDLTDPGLKTYKLFATLGASMPLFDGGLIRARLQQLLAQRTALVERRRDAELGVRREVEQALSDLRVALAVWPSDTTRVGASREALRLAEAGYKGGTGTATDVRDAEAALADARAEEAESLMDYWIARAALDHATGAAAGDAIGDAAGAAGAPIRSATGAAIGDTTRPAIGDTTGAATRKEH